MASWTPDPDSTKELPPTRWQVLRDQAVERFADATERIPLVGAAVQAARAEHDAGGGLLAGGVAYRIFFWILPAAFAASAVSEKLGIATSRSLEDAASSRGLGGLVVSAQRQAAETSASVGWYSIAVSIVLAVWFGHGVVRALNTVFALAWRQPIVRIRRPLVAGATFTLMAIVLLSVAAWINAALAGIGLGTVAFVLARVVVFAGVAFGVAIAFPHGDASRGALLPGCMLVGGAAVGMYITVNVYLAPKVGESVDTYGMLGAATVILLWLYLLARIIGISAFLNAALWRQSRTFALKSSDEPVDDSKE